VRQRARMEGDLAGNVSRPELVSEWGYDVKFAAHYLRLGYQGLGVIEHGTLQMPLEGEVREHILAVRAGQVSYDDVIAEGVELERKLEAGLESTSLPENVDMEWLNGWLAGAHRQAWRSQRWSRNLTRTNR
uniref:hypothetical protein n=1 Tax=Agromyces humi TaxID=1766800 RepID=UPI0019397AAF